jgi:HK97 family phage major capsid protein
MKRRDFLKLSPDQRREYFAREIVGKKLTRSFTVIERSAVNEEERTVEIAFSSDEPYERYFYTEILSHDAKAIMLKRLNNGGALLKDHDTRQQIGVVVPGTAKSDGHVGRCTVKFSKKQLAQDEFQDVLDGIRTKISVGYEIHKYEYAEKEETLTATLWEPLENSLVAIPADDSVGVGRSKDTGDGEDPACDNPDCEDPNCDGESCMAGDENKGSKSQSQKNQVHPAQTARVNGQPAQTRAAQLTTRKKMLRRKKKSTPPAADEITCVDGDEDCGNERCDVHYEAEERTAAPVSRDAQRAAQFVELGRIYGEEQLALDYAADEARSIEDLKKEILAKRKARATATTPNPEAPETVANRNGGGAIVTPRAMGKLRNFAKQEEAYRFGMFLAGGVFGMKSARKFCQDNGIQLRSTTHSESDNDSGGLFVPMEFAATIIDLKEKYGLARGFADVEPMGSDMKTIFRRKGGLTAYPVGAVGTSRKGTVSKLAWDAVELKARKWKVTTKIEEELTVDALLSVADKIVGEMAYAFAQAEDDCFFNGDGSSTYHGITGLRQALKDLNGTIANIAGLQVASGNAYSEIVKGDFTSLIALLPEYADNENTAFYCHRTVYWNVMVPIMLAAGGVTAAEIQQAREKQFLGYPVRISQKMPRTEANSQVCVLPRRCSPSPRRSAIDSASKSWSSQADHERRRLGQ